MANPHPKVENLVLNTPGRVVPGAGRKPSALRKRMRGCIDLALPFIEEQLKNPKLDPNDALAIIDRLGKYGLGKLQVSLDKPELLEIMLEVSQDYVLAEKWEEFARVLGEAIEDV